MLLVGQHCLTFFATKLKVRPKKNCVQIRHIVFHCLINYHSANIFLSIFRFYGSVLVTESGSLPTTIIRYQEN